MSQFKFISKNKIGNLPKESGIYCFKSNKEILYIGKAASVRERVKNHFPSRSEGERRTNVLRTQQPAYRDNLFINQVKKVGYTKTDSEIEALILEANLIKKYQPKYNVVWRDDKNYFFVGITKENFPQVFITHQTKPLNTKYKILNTKFIGPFVDGKALKETLKVLRKVFPYRSCRAIPKRACLWYHLGRCPAPCLLKSKILEVQRNANSLFEIIKGRKSQALRNLKKEMKEASKIQDFERAAKIRDQIEALEKVLAHARIFEPQLSKPTEWETVQKILQKILKIKNKISRIEAYDISNIQGQETTGSMVTFINGRPDKSFYRKFKIETPHQKFGGGPNDIAMLKEVLTRRLKHPEWPYPDLMLIDGGKAQLNAAAKCLNSKFKYIKVVALAKKRNELFIEAQKNPILLKNLPREIFNLILQLRDEAHRFARKYHLKLREIDLHLER